MTAIVGQVVQGNRPVFNEEECVELYSTTLVHLMQKCWASDPDERLSFFEIKNKLKKLPVPMPILISNELDMKMLLEFQSMWANPKTNSNKQKKRQKKFL